MPALGNTLFCSQRFYLGSSVVSDRVWMLLKRCRSSRVRGHCDGEWSPPICSTNSPKGTFPSGHLLLSSHVKLWALTMHRLEEILSTRDIRRLWSGRNRFDPWDADVDQSKNFILRRLVVQCVTGASYQWLGKTRLFSGRPDVVSHIINAAHTHAVNWHMEFGMSWACIYCSPKIKWFVFPCDQTVIFHVIAYYPIKRRAWNQMLNCTYHVIHSGIRDLAHHLV